MSIVRSDLLSSEEKRLIKHLPRETGVSLNGYVVRIGHRSQYATDTFCSSAERMRRDTQEELADYFRERVHRILKRNKESAGGCWRLFRGEREDLEFDRGDLPTRFEEEESVLLCPVTRKVRRNQRRYSTWAIIKDFISTRTYEVTAQCIVSEGGSYLIYCEEDKVQHRSGLPRHVRAANAVAEMLARYRINTAGVED